MCINLDTIISKTYYNQESFIFNRVSLSSKEYLLGLCSTSDLECCLTFSQLETAITSIESNVSSINDEFKVISSMKCYLDDDEIYLFIVNKSTNTVIWLITGYPDDLEFSFNQYNYGVKVWLNADEVKEYLKILHEARINIINS